MCNVLKTLLELIRQMIKARINNNNNRTDELSMLPGFLCMLLLQLWYTNEWKYIYKKNENVEKS